MAESTVETINQISIDKMEEFELFLIEKANNMSCNTHGCVNSCLTYFYTMEGKFDCFDLCYCYTNHYPTGYGSGGNSYELFNFFQEHNQAQPISLLYYFVIAAFIGGLVYIVHS
mmetsp:Transcript_10103/g.10050  ORF Transcript_10103/g.10050 Transcript_10103/m.10050 type:complete len:114 (-) Transcript_10103:97-438(-)